MRTKSERRHNDWRKAIRKKRISDQYACFQNNGTHWYDNLHQYSKNKIHCSCPLCRSKTNDQSVCGPAMNWPERDRKQIDRMQQDLNDLYAHDETIE